MDNPVPRLFHFLVGKFLYLRTYKVLSNFLCNGGNRSISYECDMGNFSMMLLNEPQMIYQRRE